MGVAYLYFFVRPAHSPEFLQKTNLEWFLEWFNFHFAKFSGMRWCERKVQLGTTYRIFCASFEISPKIQFPTMRILGGYPRTLVLFILL